MPPLLASITTAAWPQSRRGGFARATMSLRLRLWPEAQSDISTRRPAAAATLLSLSCLPAILALLPRPTLSSTPLHARSTEAGASARRLTTCALCESTLLTVALSLSTWPAWAPATRSRIRERARTRVAKSIDTRQAVGRARKRATLTCGPSVTRRSSLRARASKWCYLAPLRIVPICSFSSSLTCTFRPRRT